MMISELLDLVENMAEDTMMETDGDNITREQVKFVKYVEIVNYSSH